MLAGCDISHHPADRGGDVHRRIDAALRLRAGKHDMPVQYGARGVDHRIADRVVTIGAHGVEGGDPPAALRLIARPLVPFWRSDVPPVGKEFFCTVMPRCSPYPYK